MLFRTDSLVDKKEFLPIRAPDLSLANIIDHQAIESCQSDELTSVHQNRRSDLMSFLQKENGKEGREEEEERVSERGGGKGFWTRPLRSLVRFDRRKMKLIRPLVHLLLSIILPEPSRSPACLVTPPVFQSQPFRTEAFSEKIF